MTLIAPQKAYTIKLSRARVADIPRLIQIVEEAFASNLFSQLSDASVSVDRRRDMAEQLLRKYIPLPNTAIIKAEIGGAEDEEEGEEEGGCGRQIAGWSFWGFRDLERRHSRELETTLGELSGLFTSMVLGQNPQEGSLAAWFQEEERRWAEEWFRDRSVGLLGLLCVAPRFQGRGVGEKCLEWGAREMDKRGLVCHLTATPVAWRIYEMYGWHVTDVLPVDLNEWFTSGGRERLQNDDVGRDMGYGTYLWRRMIRLPKAVYSKE